MPYRDLFLPLLTYPDAPQAWAIETAVAFAAAISSKVSAIGFAVDIDAPGNLLTDVFLDLPAMVAAQEAKSSKHADQLLDSFEQAAKSRGVFEGFQRRRLKVAEVRNSIAAHARLHDLTLLPIGKVDLADQWCAETVIFESGRPTLVLPDEPERKADFSLASVLVAFDFSKAAARALADAIPILQYAENVTVLTVENEKAIDRHHTTTADLNAHLKGHGIDAEFVSVDAAGRRIGQVLADFTTETHRPNLLVMGAYGHSRMREFLLGGATKTMLSNPPLPILLSH